MITTLQNERNYGSVWLLGFEATLQLPVTSFEEAEAATDDAIATFRADLDSKPAEVREAYAPALDDIEAQLGGLRETVDDLHRRRATPRHQAVSDPFFNGYTALIDELFTANGQAALAIDDPTLRRGVELTDLASHQIEHVARLTRVLLLAGVAGGPDRADRRSPRPPGCSARSRPASTRSASSAPAATRPRREKVDQEFALVGLPRAGPRRPSTPARCGSADTMASLSREDDEGYNGFRTTVNERDRPTGPTS